MTFTYQERDGFRMEDVDAPIDRLEYESIAADAVYVATLVTADARRGFDVRLHTQNFYEVLAVVAGEVNHHINGHLQSLSPGDVVFVRPGDRHALEGGQASESARVITVSFAQDTWQCFAQSAGLSKSDRINQAGDIPPVCNLNGDESVGLDWLSHNMLVRYARGPTRLDLWLFLSTVADTFYSHRDAGPWGPMPRWLANACWSMLAEDNLRQGVRRMAELCDVSLGHLSRTLKHHSGMSPTHFINELRLQRAGMLLHSTTREISDIATSCGFDNLSYFYRLFRERFGKAPRSFRLSE